MSLKPRPINSQIPPNQKPHNSMLKTASTHSKMPIAEATAGKLYRVRDKDWVAVWGEGLTFSDANKLKNEVVGSRKSKTARVEDMDVEPPPWYLAQHQQDGQVTAAPAPTMEVDMVGAHRMFSIEGSDPVEIPGDGVISSIPAGHELRLIHSVGQMITGARQVPCAVTKGDVYQAVPIDPVIAAAQAAARAAVVAHMATQPKQPKYLDYTVKAPKPRAAPPPRDRTASTEPVFQRLGAPPSPPEPNKEDLLPSPLAVATQTDGTPAAPGEVHDDDLAHLMPDLGAGPSKADLEHAQRQQAAERGPTG